MSAHTPLSTDRDLQSVQGFRHGHRFRKLQGGDLVPDHVLGPLKALTGMMRHPMHGFPRSPCVVRRRGATLSPEIPGPWLRSWAAPAPWLHRPRLPLTTPVDGITAVYFPQPQLESRGRMQRKEVDLVPIRQLEVGRPLVEHGTCLAMCPCPMLSGANWTSRWGTGPDLDPPCLRRDPWGVACLHRLWMKLLNAVLRS